MVGKIISLCLRYKMDFYEIDEFIEAKRKLRIYNRFWKKYSGRTFVGDCSYLYKKLKPTSYQDFYEKYTKDGEESTEVDEKKRGRTYNEIVELAKKYREDVGDYQVSLEDYIRDIYMHVIIETYDGQKIEEMVSSYIESKGFEVSRCSGDKDALKSIDLEIKKNGNEDRIQIKPISFFNGNRNLSLRDDRKRIYENAVELYKEEGKVLYFIIYEINDKRECRFVTKPNGKITFKYDELFNNLRGVLFTNGKMREFILDKYKLEKLCDIQEAKENT